jgi:alanine racemase
LSALVHNAGVLRRAIPSGTRLGLMVKANGYGHGLEMAARAAVSGGADQLMVASLDEGLALRRAGISAPLLVVYSVLPDAVDDAVHAGLELSVSGVESANLMLDAWRRVAGRRPGDALRVHVEVDTGMGRGGVPADALAGVVDRIDASPATILAGLWSHLTDGSDAGRSREQAARFEAALAGLAGRSTPAPVRHIAATEGLFCDTAPVYDMVRIGIGYYGEVGLGVAPAPHLAALAAELRPAMSVKARPMRLERMPAGASVGYGREWTADRPSLIATLPIGYADGWSRRYWPGAMALLRGRRVPLVGRVSMDSICVDVTDAGDDVTIDEEFVLLGAQGTERIPVTELAALRGSIPNEVFCSFGARLHRDYLDVDGVVARSDQEEHLERVGSGRPG